MKNSLSTMKVEIWSDIMCPFCYIGKRKYEAAVQRLKDSSVLKVEWYSYQLDPTIPQEESERVDYFTYLQDRKNMGREQVNEMFDAITKMGAEEGIEFNFKDVIVANSIHAHRLLQLAKREDLSNEAEEILFKAHFTDGVDIGNKEALVSLGMQMGLEQERVKEVIYSDLFSYEVNQDIREAENIGVKGVPFFVFNRKYGISGAQPVEVFVETLEKAIME